MLRNLSQIKQLSVLILYLSLVNYDTNDNISLRQYNSLIISKLYNIFIAQFFPSNMGRAYIQNLGGSRIVTCRCCKTYLTNRSELISHRFQGATGRAYLFDRAWNLDYSDAQHRDMMTGKHIVRDVTCKVCHKKLGWMYEFAMEESQRYKEARVILEKALIDEEDGFADPVGALETHEQPPSNPQYENSQHCRGYHTQWNRVAVNSPNLS